jgi:hypothetical protein
MIGWMRERLRICSFIDARRPSRSSFHDRLYIVFRNLLLLDEHKRLRHVLRGNDVADAHANSEENDRADQ